MAHHLVLYDGVCGLCDRTLQYILARDRRDVFHFAAQQSEAGRAWLAKFGRDPSRLESLYVIPAYDAPGRPGGPVLLEKSRAALFIGETLGGLTAWAKWLGFLPRAWLDALYGFVARNRYRVFGRLESCLLPEPRHRAKFLEGAQAHVEGAER